MNISLWSLIRTRGRQSQSTLNPLDPETKDRNQNPNQIQAQGQSSIPGEERGKEVELKDNHQSCPSSLSNSPSSSKLSHLENERDANFDEMDGNSHGGNRGSRAGSTCDRVDTYDNGLNYDLFLDDVHDYFEGGLFWWLPWEWDWEFNWRRKSN